VGQFFQVAQPEYTTVQLETWEGSLTPDEPGSWRGRLQVFFPTDDIPYLIKRFQET
jgi:hypothetical protein